MDTPDNSKTLPNPSLISKFEDSPVFNYISTLSPIKQFSLNHSTQSFHLLNFASPQSLQTPPINCPKESNITSGNHASESSLNNSQDGIKGRNADMSDSVQPCDTHIQEKDKFNSGQEVYVPTTNEAPKVKYECVSPESIVVFSGNGKPDCEFGMVGTEIVPGNIIQDDPEELGPSPENQIEMERIEGEHNKEVCDWEKFICEASDIFDCQSPNKGTHHEDQHDENDDSGALSFIKEFLQTPNENTDDSQKIESICPLNSSENHRGAGKCDETSRVSSVRARAVLAEEVVHYAKTEVDDQSSTQQQQTTRRRCLVYEMSGSHYRKMMSDSTGGSPVSNTATPHISDEKCLVANKLGNKISSKLPGIGLHLNALAATGRDKIIVKRESMACRRQLISAPSTMYSYNSRNPDMESPNPPKVGLEVLEKTCEVQKDDTFLNENVSENSVLNEGIELPQSSPKKKRKKPDNVGDQFVIKSSRKKPDDVVDQFVNKSSRQKTDNVGDPDSCKRCNCKRSKCLKLYCECFAAGLYCVEPCNCQDCFNKPAHEDTVLETRRQIESRNPLAFAPKVILCAGTPNTMNELKKTPASARHKRGCNCKKSGCLKKYCECFQGGVGCSLSCRCEGCKNTFGRKEGIEGIVFEAHALQRHSSNVGSHYEVSKTDRENQAPEEPSNNERQIVRRPFQFVDTAPPLPLLLCAQPLQPCTIQKSDDSNHTAMVDKQDLIPDDEASDSAKGEYLLPAPSVKSTSPNCKRISSDHHDIEPSPGWKSCRKLILRSIPSFSTVAKEQESTKVQGKLH